MTTQAQKAAAFRALHERDGAFIIPNPWDAGTARLLTALGFEALATTSLGLANTLGRADGTGAVSRAEVLANCAEIAGATHLPVSADLENCYAHEPRAAAEMIRLAAEAGVVGGSIEDATGDAQQPIYEFELAVERVHAAAEMARSLAFPFTLTARAENFLHGRRDLDDTIRRLQAFERRAPTCCTRQGCEIWRHPHRGILGEKAAQCGHERRRPGSYRGATRAGRRQAHQRRRRAVQTRACVVSQGGARDEGAGRLYVDPRHGVRKRAQPAVPRVMKTPLRMAFALVVLAFAADKRRSPDARLAISTRPASSRSS